MLSLRVQYLEKGFVLWFTGLPASGKTTIASIIRKEFLRLGKKVELLDGDDLRKNLDPEIGFSPEDRAIHIRRVAYIGNLLARNGVATLVCLVSPYIHTRTAAKKLIGEKFIEVYVKCSLKTCIDRDPKGLYKKAMEGEITNMTGIGDPYEEPLSPDILIDNEKNNADTNAKIVLAKLRDRGII